MQAVVFLAMDLEGIDQRGGAASGTLDPAMPTPSVSRMKVLACSTAAGGMAAKRSPAAWAARRWAASGGLMRRMMPACRQGCYSALRPGSHAAPAWPRGVPAGPRSAPWTPDRDPFDRAAG